MAREHLMGVGVSVGGVHVVLNGRSMREMMKSEYAQALVNEKANAICELANATHTTKGAEYVVHPRVLEVSAHAFVDPANYRARIDEAYHQTLDIAFWAAK